MNNGVKAAQFLNERDSSPVLLWTICFFPSNRQIHDSVTSRLPIKTVRSL
jgi:hypothetical protein